MELTVLSDIHGNIENLKSISGVIAKSAGVLIAGDITHFGGSESAREVIDTIRRYNGNIYAVPGNCDTEEAAQFLSDENLNLDGKTIQSWGLHLLGLGGSLPAPVYTPTTYSEEDFEKRLDSFKFTDSAEPAVVICHQPPLKTKLDKAFGLKHVGSRAVRRFIETRQPDLFICGHIHESSGRDFLGSTQMVNPGALKNGRFCRIVFSSTGIETVLEKI